MFSGADCDEMSFVDQCNADIAWRRRFKSRLFDEKSYNIIKYKKCVQVFSNYWQNLLHTFGYGKRTKRDLYLNDLKIREGVNKKKFITRLD